MISTVFSTVFFCPFSCFISVGVFGYWMTTMTSFTFTTWLNHCKEWWDLTWLLYNNYNANISQDTMYQCDDGTAQTCKGISRSVTKKHGYINYISRLNCINMIAYMLTKDQKTPIPCPSLKISNMTRLFSFFPLSRIFSLFLSRH